MSQTIHLKPNVSSPHALSLKPHALSLPILPLLLLASIPSTWAAPARKAPHIGYLYPAGGKQGTTLKVLAGGQLLRGASDVYITGEGVHASIIKYYKPIRNLMPDQRRELLRRLVAAKEKRLAEMPGNTRPQYLPFPGERRSRRGRPKNKAKNKTGEPASQKQSEDPNPKPVVVPEHPLLEQLEGKSLRELYHVVDTFLNFKELKKKQLNRQLMEMVLIEVRIDPGATPGDRELRFKTPLGLTRPVCFQVGTLPEVCELEPNDTRAFTNLPEAPPIKLPALINGQVMPGDVDRFRFHARRGQKLVIQANARRLIPFLADAVPGWFQATLTLYDEKDREVAFADDYRFHPDPVLRFQVPTDGVYELEVRDAIYRGREDFVYRLAVGELPFIDRIFPLGARLGTESMATAHGPHLSKTRLKLDTRPGINRIRSGALSQGGRTTNEMLYVVDELPEKNETEPNDEVSRAQSVSLPQIVNGRISRSGDVDLFKFEGRRGDELVAEVTARRLHSPLDSMLRVTDATGTVLAWNDDNVKKEGHLHPDMGTLTHHADSYVHTRLPRDGTYYVRLTDTRRQGSEAHAYRLRISHPRPDFTLYVSPSSLTIPPSGVAVLTAYVLRKDGFRGDINVALKDAPAGFALNGARIPFGRTQVRMTLSATGKPLKQPIALHLEGRACVHPVAEVPRFDGETVVRPARPADNVMQAFLWRHLVPTRQLLVAFSRGGQRRPLQIVGAPLRIQQGSVAEVRIKGPKSSPGREIKLELSDPPPGVSIEKVRFVGGSVALQVKLEEGNLKPGFTGNLIVQASVDYEVKAKQGDKAPPRKRRHTLGMLPAIPFEVIQRNPTKLSTLQP